MADLLRQQITRGRYSSGGLLPDERSLGAALGASRNAVREALGLLRAEGLIVRGRGVGTMVLTPAHEVTRPPAPAARRLGLRPDEGAVYIERLRRLDGTPLSLDASYLTVDIARPLLERDLAGRDLFALIEESTGQPLGRAELALHAVTASRETAALLGIDEGAAVFAVGRLARLADGRPVDRETLHIRADRLTFHAVVHRAQPSTTTGDARTTPDRLG